MNHSDSIKEISSAIWKAQRKIKSALKDSTNPHFKSKYADLSSVIEAVKEPLSSEGISFLQGVFGRDSGVAVETMLLHVSGEWMSSTLEIPASKHDAQGYGSAITYGRRYGLQAMCGVPAEDDDGNAATASAPPKHSAKALTTDAFESLPKEKQEMILETALQVADHLSQGRDWDAYALCETMVELEDKLGLWSRLDSKSRSRIKKQQEFSKSRPA